MRQLFQYHPAIGYHFVPGLTARIPHEGGGYSIRVNSLGFRSRREYQAAKNPGTRRILVFGDSFTAGDGVADEDRYTDLLETEIPNLETYNFGLPGSGTDQQYLAYRHFSAGIEHDLLMIAILVDNIRRIKSVYRPYLDEAGVFTAYAKPYFELERGQLVLRNVPVPRVPPDQARLTPQQSETLRRMKDHGRQFAGGPSVPEYDRPDDPSWLLMRAILEGWIQGHSAPVLLVPVPLWQFVEDDWSPQGYQDRFREVSAATGCHLHDPLEDLRRYTPAERRAFRWQRDIHLTPAGHAALAKSLKRSVLKIIDPAGGRTAGL